MSGTIGERIVAQARRTPDAVALRQWDVTLTYRELVAAAVPLAARLRAAGAGPEMCVGSCTDRTPDMVISVLGILLSGAAFVPLDTNHPPRRLVTILDDARAALVVADAAGAEPLAETGRTIVPVRREPAADREDMPDAADSGVLPANAAYVMYTSGSTGRPKGVVVSHANVLAYVSLAVDLLGLGPDSRSIGFASLGFDASVGDILVPLLSGGSIQLLSSADRTDPARLQRFLRHHQATWGYLPPSLLPLLDPSLLPDLTDVISAGEPALPDQVDRWSGPAGPRFRNWYGPTETTVSVTGDSFDGVWTQPLPIGRPLPGVRAYVLDERMRPCPPGVSGELCIGGPQVTRGYLGLPGRTADVFVPDPVSGEPGARLYRTGDRVAWRDDGMLSYLGRMDRQVKMHGQRVEIGEIEVVLGQHPEVRQAVVDVASTTAGVKQLVAYLTPADAPAHDEIREYCAERLPAYMIPNRVVRVATLPLTPAGKVDMAALRATAPVMAREAREPAEPCLAAVAAAWADVLDTPAPGPDAGFFESGGHSILAMRLVATLRARTGRAVSVEDVYEAQTVAGLAARLAGAPPAPDQDVLPRSSPPALSPAQRRIWFVEQVAPGTAAHNTPFAQRLRGPLDVAKLRGALRATAARQEVLRWRIGQRDGVPEVIAGPPGEVPLAIDDLSGQPAGTRRAMLRELLERTASTPFDLAAGPLWRARLIRLAEQDHVLALTVHHVVFDGASISVLYRDIARAYQGLALEPLSHTFADYVRWLDGKSAAATSGGELAWWAGHLRDAPAVLDLPRDRPRPTVQTFRGASHAGTVDPATTARLRTLAADAGATLFAALLAAFAHLAGRLAGTDDLVIGTPLADRRELAFEPVAGLLLHIVPLRVRLPADATFAGLLRQCRDETAAAFGRADVPFERIVDAVGGPRGLSRNPLVQVLFNMYNFGAEELLLPGVSAEPVTAGLPGALFDLTLYVTVGRGLRLEVVYNTDLYDAGRISALLTSYIQLLGECAAKPDAPLRELPLRPADSGLPGWDTVLPSWDGPDIVSQVRAAADARGHAVAAGGAGGPLTYRDVAEIAGGTAAALRAAGLGQGDVVAVLGARDCRLPAVLLGALGAGCRWMIADPGMPGQVLARQVAVAGPRALLCLAKDAQVPAALAQLAMLTPDRGTAALDGGNAGYLLFTSGTAGEPAAVLTSARPLAHFADWYRSSFGISTEDRFALLSGLSHDPVLRDMFVPLTTGATLCVPGEDMLRDPAALFSWLREQRITVAHLTPQLARLIAMAPQAAAGQRLMLRFVAFGGDQSGAADVAAIRAMAPGARIVNFYGTTETPQAQAWYEPPDRAEELLPAGHGADGAALLVLDAAGRPAAVGELGDVVIRSRHLADGYTDPALTGQRFGHVQGSDPGDRFFRTGDRGRHRADGAVVLAGRADGQVKIRGYRVETAEVAAALAGLADVRQACVVAAGDGPERQLVACAVPAGPAVRPAALLGELRQLLPGYAVPARITLLPRLPLTPNGKVDHATVLREVAADLAAPVRSDGSGALAGPAEHAIAGAWREVLGIPAVGPHDNFFDIGGHSLALAAVQARLAERMSRQVTVLDLFRHPTIRELAAHLNGQATDPVFQRAAYRAAQRRQARRLTAGSREKQVPDVREGA